MADRPGTKTAAFIVFAIVDVLVRKLVAKGELTKAEAVAMHEGLAKRFPAWSKYPDDPSIALMESAA
jgi:hypothetical protein